MIGRMKRMPTTVVMAAAVFFTSRPMP